MGLSGRLTLPTALHDDHDLGAFGCGNEILNGWLHRHARRNMKSGGTRVYVTCLEGSSEVVAYYGLSTADVSHALLSGRLRRNMPDPVPAVLLGRLAITKSRQGQGLGGDLLGHAIGQALKVAELAGARLLLVHAIDEAAESFYRHNSFTDLPGTSRTLALDLVKLQRELIR